MNTQMTRKPPWTRIPGMRACVNNAGLYHKPPGVLKYVTLAFGTGKETAWESQMVQDWGLHTKHTEWSLMEGSICEKTGKTKGLLTAWTSLKLPWNMEQP